MLRFIVYLLISSARKIEWYRYVIFSKWDFTVKILYDMYIELKLELIREFQWNKPQDKELRRWMGWICSSSAASGRAPQ